MPTNKAIWFDALERIFWTAVQTFLGTLLATNLFLSGTNLGGWQDALVVSATAAGVAVIKVVLAIAATHNSTPQLGVDTYEPKPEGEVSP